MSWGYFIDLDLSLPTTVWTRLKDDTSAAHPIAPGWWRFQDKALEAAFMKGVYEKVTFEKAFAWFDGGKEAVCRVRSKNGRTTIRLATLLDKSGELYMARPFASLLAAARNWKDAAGRIALVNDGTYSGEHGSVVSLENGKLTAEPIRDDWEARMESLMGEVFGAEVFEDLPARKTPRAEAKAKVSAKKPAAKKAKRPERTAAMKKTKAPAKKAAVKKAAVKKPTAKKAKAPAKKAPSRQRSQ